MSKLLMVLVTILGFTAILVSSDTVCDTTCTTANVACPTFGVCDGSKCQPMKNLAKDAACGTGGRSCAKGLYCKDNKCATLLADGAACTTHSECNSTMCSREKKCAPVFFVGDACTDPADEQGKNVECPAGSNCLRSTAGSVHCTGVASGAKCDLTTDVTKTVLCDKGMYCQLSGTTNGTCATVLAEGATCKKTLADAYACGPLASCNGAASTTSGEGKCQLWFSQSTNAKCDNNVQCKWGEYCQGGVCVAVDNNTICSNKANETCGNTYGECNCVSGSQKCVVPQTGKNCGNFLLNLITCMHNKKCTANSFPREYVWRDVNSCAYSCNQHYLDFACCVNRPQDLPNGVACPLPDRLEAVATGIPVFILVALFSLAVLLEWPQQLAPGCWLSMCQWRWWPEQIEDFKRRFMEDNEPTGIKKDD